MEQLQSGDVNTFRSTKCDVEQAVKRVSFRLRSGRFISRHPKHNIPQHKRRKTGIVWRSWLWQCGNHPPPTKHAKNHPINVFTNKTIPRENLEKILKRDRGWWMRAELWEGLQVWSWLDPPPTRLVPVLDDPGPCSAVPLDGWWRKRGSLGGGDG